TKIHLSLVVAGQRKMDFGGQRLDALQKSYRLGYVAGGILTHAQLGHLVNQLGVEEGLFAWLCLVCLGFKSRDALFVGNLVVGGIRAHRHYCEAQCQQYGKPNLSPHKDSPLDAVRLWRDSHDSHSYVRTARGKMREFVKGARCGTERATLLACRTLKRESLRHSLAKMRSNSPSDDKQITNKSHRRQRPGTGFFQE